MLYVSLVLSLVLLVLAVRAARGNDASLGYFLWCGGMFWMLPSLANVSFPSVICEFLALTVVVFFCLKAAGRGRRLALPVALAATTIVYGIATLVSVHSYWEVLRLGQMFPKESVEDRIPEPGPSCRAEKLSPPAEEQLKRLDHELVTRWFRQQSRNSSLRALHSDALTRFVNSPGFGVGRIRRPTEAEIRRGVREITPVLQPVPRSAPGESLAVTQPRSLIDAEEVLQTLHRNGIADFANPVDFGYVEDRRHVTGHFPHAFSKLPEPAEQWQVETLDLVSLLRHAEPVAYVSAELPRMEELRNAPTRPLDEFESAGLRKLQAGETLIVGDGEARLRMLGSIRSLWGCTRCHGCERGDLLGAFSYTLRKKGP